MKILIGVWAVVLMLIGPSVPLLRADDSAPAPKLLLNAQRLRRLKRDRERNTPRWVNFENRVNGVPDSPERGFELALYYAVTGDEARGKEAVAWGLVHADARQRALILDWCAALVSPEVREKFGQIVFFSVGRFRWAANARDVFFLDVASGKDVAGPSDSFAKNVLDEITRSGFEDASDLYAFCEYVYALRSVQRMDLRERDAHYFAMLPEIFLLSAKPEEFNSPYWQRHAAGLALVALDPNLPSSQFLQSWVMEDSQMIREGPGVAYELLWADPYLPGVGYQNMEPWVYDDEHGTLLARSSWEADSCWIDVSRFGTDADHCAPNWEMATTTFGHLTLIPMTERCVEIPHVSSRNDSVLVWRLKPHAEVTYGKGKDARTTSADAAGIWRPGSAIEGKVCIAAAH